MYNPWTGTKPDDGGRVMLKGGVCRVEWEYKGEKNQDNSNSIINKIYQKIKENKSSFCFPI